jgi:hypothetical protein
MKTTVNLVPPGQTLNANVEFLGKLNIKRLIYKWQDAKYSHRQNLIALKNQLKAVKNFNKESAKYENPTGCTGVNHQGQLVPCDRESFVRKKNATTFNICGWCQFARCGTYINGMMIQSYCHFDEIGNEKTFNTPCFLKNTPLDKIIKSKQNQIEECIKAIANAKESIKTLRVLYNKTTKKPVLPNLRNWSHFNVGDKVVAVYEEKEVHGQVVPGYRHQDGLVSIFADNKIHDNLNNCGGHGIWLSDSSPNVMHLWEYEFLKKDTHFAKVFGIRI